MITHNYKPHNSIIMVNVMLCDHTTEYVSVMMHPNCLVNLNNAQFFLTTPSTTSAFISLICTNI